MPEGQYKWTREEFAAVYPTLVDVIRAQDAATKSMKRVAAANVIRCCQRPGGEELSDVAVARRVGMMLPSEVAAVRREIEQNGFLAEEVALREANRRGSQ